MSVQIVTNFNNLPALAAQLQAAVNAGLEGLGEEIYSDAYANTARATGALAESLDYEVSSDGVLVVAYGEEYAPYVELGSAHQAAQPALTPAFDRYATPEGVADVVGQAVEAAAEGGI